MSTMKLPVSTDAVVVLLSITKDQERLKLGVGDGIINSINLW